MKQVTFITGNQNKADYLAKFLGIEIKHQKVDVDEIQSLNLQEIVENKVRHAYEIVQGPVLVEDVGLEFKALGGLPGPFVKFFLEAGGNELLCKILEGFSDRSAVARCTFAYYDGQELEFFEGSLEGTVADAPRGENGWGWDQVFIPIGYGGRTRAELNPVEDEETYRMIKPFAKLKEFLNTK